MTLMAEDCHSSSGTTESGLAWGTKFADNVDVMKEWLSIHVRELIVVAPDNLHADLPDKEESWFAVFATWRCESCDAEKFGTCFVMDESIEARHLPTRTETSCVRITGEDHGQREGMGRPTASREMLRPSWVPPVGSGCCVCEA
eukprot:Skav205627  [mRNA]  locus=scaffold1575:44571:45102:+ [translate_table: standard]